MLNAMTGKEILIVGAGIGGLSLALALHRAGQLGVVRAAGMQARVAQRWYLNRRRWPSGDGPLAMPARDRVRAGG